MCWDPVSNVAEVWCCSEHYLWLFDGDLYLDPFTAVYCCCAVVSEDAKAKLAVHKLYLSKGGRTRCQGVLEHGLNLHQNLHLQCPQGPQNLFFKDLCRISQFFEEVLWVL